MNEKLEAKLRKFCVWYEIAFNSEEENPWCIRWYTKRSQFNALHIGRNFGVARVDRKTKLSVLKAAVAMTQNFPVH